MLHAQHKNGPWNILVLLALGPAAAAATRTYHPGDLSLAVKTCLRNINIKKQIRPQQQRQAHMLDTQIRTPLLRAHESRKRNDSDKINYTVVLKILVHSSSRA